MQDIWFWEVLLVIPMSSTFWEPVSEINNPSHHVDPFLTVERTAAWFPTSRQNREKGTRLGRGKKEFQAPSKITLYGRVLEVLRWVVNMETYNQFTWPQEKKARAHACLWAEQVLQTEVILDVCLCMQCVPLKAWYTSYVVSFIINSSLSNFVVRMLVWYFSIYWMHRSCMT